jgi:hypothetical protein
MVSRFISFNCLKNKVKRSLTSETKKLYFGGGRARVVIGIRVDFIF